MNKRIGWKSVVGISALVLGCGIGTIQVQRANAPSATTTDAKASNRVVFDWSKGTRYVYDIDIALTQSMAIPGVALNAKNTAEDNTLSLHGELLLSCYGFEDDAYVVGISFRNIDRHALTLMGTDVLATTSSVEKTFARHEAIVRIRKNGAVDATYFRKQAPALFRAMTRAALGLAQVTLPSDEASSPQGTATSWAALEPAPLGTAESNYAFDPDSSLRIVRTRAKYTKVDALAGLGEGAMPAATTQSVTSRGVITLDGRGHLAGLDDEETASFNEGSPKATRLTAKTAFRMSAKGTESFVPDTTLDLDSLDIVRPGELAAVASDEHAALEQLAAGVDLESIEARITSYAGGALENGFMQRASSFLKLRPESCLDLLEMFREPNASVSSRLLILDLFAATGHGAAQSALRSALESREVAADGPMFTRMVQRFSFVEKPDAESIAFLERTLVRAKTQNDSNVRYGATYALGSIAAHLAGAGDVAGARAQVTRLKLELSTSKTSDDKSAALIALGSAHSPEATSTIRSFASDEEASVRESAAYALGDAGDAESRRVLLELSGDGDRNVVEAALGSLGSSRLAPSELAQVANLASNEQRATGTNGLLVEFLARQASSGADVGPILEGLLPRVENEPRLHARVAQILDYLRTRS